MAFNTRSLDFFARLIFGKFRKEVPGIDPTIDSSLAKASTVSTAAAAVSLEEGVADAVEQSFVQNQDGEFLELTAEYDNVRRFDPQPSSGFGAAPGTLGTIVPQDTPVTFNGKSFLTLSDSSVMESLGNVSLSISSGLVTAVTSAEHSLSSGLSVVISGATQTEYNGTFEITVIDSNTFVYELEAGALLTDAGQFSSEYALLNLESVNTGADQNVSSGAVMSINVTGLDGQVYAGVDGISGGLDEEDDDDLRPRTLEAHNLTPGIATPPSIKFSAKSVAGNTRVFVVRPDGSSGGTQGQAGYVPQVGEAVVYILRDNDPSILPSQPELDETKAKIISDGHWPTFLDEESLFVIAPDIITQDFNFTSITPNTTTMQNAINTQLVAFFEDNADVSGITIPLDTLDSFLRQIQDPSTGEFLTAFTYTVPGVAITSAIGEILTRGVVTFG